MPTKLRLYSVIPRPVDPGYSLVQLAFEENGPDSIKIKVMRPDGQPHEAGNLLTITVDAQGGLYVVAHSGVSNEIPLAGDARGRRIPVDGHTRPSQPSPRLAEESVVTSTPTPPQQYGGVSALGGGIGFDYSLYSTPPRRRP